MKKNPVAKIDIVSISLIVIGSVMMGAAISALLQGVVIGASASIADPEYEQVEEFEEVFINMKRPSAL
jgi:hypothetical protein